MLRAVAGSVRLAHTPSLCVSSSRLFSTKYTKSHEWIRVDGDVGTVGISDHAQAELGDVVFVDLSAASGSLAAGDVFGAVESVKAASDLYLPVSGTIVETNAALEDAPDTVNSSPEQDGWMIRVKVSDPAELDGLMDEAAYQAFKDSDDAH